MLLLLYSEGASGDLQFLSLRVTAVCTRACISALLRTLTPRALRFRGVTGAVTSTGFQGFLLFLNFP